MAAYTYWRLRCSGIGYVEIREMAFLDASQVSLSVGGTPTASSQYSGAYTPAMAFDGNTSTYWSSAATAGDEWVQYQHAAPVDPVFVMVRGAGNPPTAMWIEGSNSTSGPWERRNMLGGAARNNVAEVYSLTTAQYGIATASFLMPTVWEPQFSTNPVTTLNLFKLTALTARDMVHGGPGWVYGRAYLAGSPSNVPFANARVRLSRDVDDLPLRETFSDATGYYEFRDLSMDYRYTAKGYDVTHDKRGVVADNLPPELMP